MGSKPLETRPDQYQPRLRATERGDTMRSTYKQQSQTTCPEQVGRQTASFLSKVPHRVLKWLLVWRQRGTLLVRAPELLWLHHLYLFGLGPVHQSLNRNRVSWRPQVKAMMTISSREEEEEEKEEQAGGDDESLSKLGDNWQAKPAKIVYMSIRNHVISVTSAPFVSSG